MINSFSNFLVEEEKTVYFTFGRMNPPTIGHEKLLTALSRKAGRNPYRVFLSPSQDKDKNPLDYKSKVKFARKAFPKHARSIVSSPTTRNIMDVASKIFDEGFKNVIMAAEKKYTQLQRIKTLEKVVGIMYERQTAIIKALTPNEEEVQEADKEGAKKDVH